MTAMTDDTAPHAPLKKPAMSAAAMVLALCVALLWGFNFAASKFALEHFPPFFVIFIRYALVALALVPFAKRIDLPPKHIFILSLLMISLHFTLVFSALWLGLDIGTTVIAIQLGTPFTCVLGALFLKDYLGPWRSAGMVIAFMGIVILAGTPSVSGNMTAFLLAIAGSAAWAGSNVYMKGLKPIPVMPLMFWTALYSLPQTLLVSLVIESDHLVLLQTGPWQSWVGIGYSAFMSTIMGYGLWYWLMKRYDVTQVVPFALVVPVGGLSSGVIFFHEVLSAQILIGAAVTILGVAIITIRHPRLTRLERS